MFALQLFLSVVAADLVRDWLKPLVRDFFFKRELRERRKALWVRVTRPATGEPLFSQSLEGNFVHQEFGVPVVVQVGRRRELL